MPRLTHNFDQPPAKDLMIPNVKREPAKVGQALLVVHKQNGKLELSWHPDEGKAMVAVRASKRCPAWILTGPLAELQTKYEHLSKFQEMTADKALELIRNPDALLKVFFEQNVAPLVWNAKLIRDATEGLKGDS